MGILSKLKTSISNAGWPTSSPEQIAEAMRVDYANAPILYDPNGYFYGPVAQGLALAAPMVRAADGRWNSPTDGGHYSDAEVREIVNDTWGIRDAERWSEVLGMLIDCEYGDWLADQATIVRTRTKARLDVPVLDDTSWAQAIADEVARRGASAELLGEMQARIPKVRAAEETLRTARLLGADEEVQALGAYDLVRAGNLVRWGVRLGYGEPDMITRVALLSRDAVVGTYSSWRDYGLGLSAGRIVTYPDTWGRDIVDTIAWARPLLDSVNSPWNNLPFPTETVLPDPEPAQ